ncbi:MAG: CusA/CzcA family heavy metal efflux RND transporter [Chitinophagales bacterium]|nr:CusA/CzcA family heavy metal efflux RND transporter [Chitinophagales bacterium]
MIDRIIAFSIKNKLIIGIFTLLLTAFGIYSLTRLSVDALPDITTNQVNIVTWSPNLAAQEVEQFITFPIEQTMSNIPKVTEVRSISRFGLSVVTVVFRDDMDTYFARQLVGEKLNSASQDIPEKFGKPEISANTTGLGEIYQYVVHTKPGYEKKYNAMDLRTIEDWIVRRQLMGVAGIADISSFGGQLKQYEVSINPDKLRSMNISISEVFEALEKNNNNTGGSYIEKGPSLYFIRAEGLAKSISDIENIVVKNNNGLPVLIRDIATAQFSAANRYGALTRNGEGEVVGGVVLMLKGANSKEVILNVKERITQIESSLPEGVIIEPFIDRTKLIDKTTSTVSRNLLEGALIVIFILVLLLGNFRAGLIVASVIPLSMLFAIILMNAFGITANLMSMGALDFGLIVDGAVIIVESVLHHLHSHFKNKMLTKNEMDEETEKTSVKIIRPAVFGVIIILIVYLPILSLVGIEGKMFRPMAQTVGFALIGAMLLSLTYVPMMCSLFINRNIKDKVTVADKIIHAMQRFYEPALRFALRFRKSTVAVAAAMLAISIFIFINLGGEFIPTLQEGDFAVEARIMQGSSVNETVRSFSEAERILKAQFPEVIQVISKIGSGEIPTDPMPIESGDIMIILKDKSEWTSAITQEELSEKMEDALKVIPGLNVEFQQPIQMRFNEMIAGIKSDVAIKIFGEDLDILTQKANEVQSLIKNINGIASTKVEQVDGLPQIVIIYNRAKMAQYGLNVDELNTTVNTAFAGAKAGTVYEGEKRFDLIIKLDEEHRSDIESVRNLFVPLPSGSQITLQQVADVSFKSDPVQISREDAKRRIYVGLNTRGRDVQSVVKDIQKTLNEKLKLPPGYFITYGGQFQNLEEASKRLSIAVPVALLLILLMLFFTFRSVSETLMIFTAIPFSAIGGIIALWLRGMNFSISAGVGFIALFGVAVLNGIVLIAYFNRLKNEGEENITTRIMKGTKSRLRPVIATAAVASLGFLPMALSTSPGSEVQKPLATVVIGGLISSTILTLIVLPVLYSLFFSRKKNENKISSSSSITAIVILIIGSSAFATSANAQTTQLGSLVNFALQNHPYLQTAGYNLQQQQVLKKNSFTLSPLSAEYTNGQINTAARDYNITVQQGFQFPTVYAAQSKLNNQNIQLAQQQYTLTKNELVKNVTTAYYQLLYGHEQLKLYEQLDSIFKNFSEVADKKYQAGETAELEKFTTQSQWQQLKIKSHEAQSDVEIFQTTLQQWLNTTQPIVLSEQNLQAISPPIALDTSQLYGSPLLQYQKQLVNVANAEWKYDRSKFAPSLSFGYFNQSMDNAKGFQGYIIGAQIPLFKSGVGNNSRASHFNVMKTQSEADNFKLQLNTEYSTAIQNFNKYKQSLQYYQSSGLQMADKILSSAQIGYQEGEINYVEYVQSIKQAIFIKTDYLQTLNNYNQSVIYLNYLISK